MNPEPQPPILADLKEAFGRPQCPTCCGTGQGNDGERFTQEKCPKCKGTGFTHIASGDFGGSTEECDCRQGDGPPDDAFDAWWRVEGIHEMGHYGVDELKRWARSAWEAASKDLSFYQGKYRELYMRHEHGRFHDKP